MREPFAPQAVVFDMDGLLLDTESIALATFEEACRAHGLEVERSVYERCIGTSTAGTREILGRALGFDVYDRIGKDWFERYGARVRTQAVDVKDGGHEVLELTRSLGIPVALATSTATELARIKLRLVGLLDFFVAIVGGDAVANPKPHPEPYLTAAATLGFAPNRCWAIEDSDNGVRAAHAAGLFVFQVPDLVQPAAEVRGIGHPVVLSLRDVARVLIERFGERSGERTVT